MNPGDTDAEVAINDAKAGISFVKDESKLTWTNKNTLEQTSTSTQSARSPAHSTRAAARRGPWYTEHVDQGTAARLLAAERAAVLERLAGLERELAGIIEASASANADDEHDPEGATVAFERQHLAALAAAARDHLAQVGAAEERLAGGTYGQCEGCGQDISPARLAARPVSTLCITCAARR